MAPNAHIVPNKDMAQREAHGVPLRTRMSFWGYGHHRSIGSSSWLLLDGQKVIPVRRHPYLDLYPGAVGPFYGAYAALYAALPGFRHCGQALGHVLK